VHFCTCPALNPACRHRVRATALSTPSWALYSPKSHRITMLHSQAEALDDRLKPIWPSDSKLHRQAFDLLRRAYVEARYSAEYTVSDEELAWLVERVTRLQEIVAAVCQDRLNSAHTRAL